MVEENETWPLPVVGDLPEASKEKIRKLREARGAFNPLNNLTEKKEEELKKQIVAGISERKWAFDPTSGTIKTYDTKEEFDEDMKKGTFVSIDRPPSKTCSCYGRGYIGRDIRINLYLPCDCMFDIKKKIRLKGK
jgi:predicted nucleotide-binding protein (sugar kinase/HSP70/actin superfamily)